MRGINLRSVYESLFQLGIVRSKRQFSRDYLGRHWSYLRDFEARDRDDVRIPAKTVAALKTRLRTIARLTPPLIRIEVERVVANIERDAQIADFLRHR